MTRLLTAVLLTLLTSLPVYAQSADTGKAVCLDAERYINQLVDFAKTQCAPAAGKDGAMSFVVVVDKPILSTKDAKKGWLLVTVGALGKLLNERPRLKVDELHFSDVKRANERQGFTLPLVRVKAWQRDMHSGAKDIDVAYAELERAIVTKQLPPR